MCRLTFLLLNRGCLRAFRAFRSKVEAMDDGVGHESMFAAFAGRVNVTVTLVTMAQTMPEPSNHLQPKSLKYPNPPNNPRSTPATRKHPTTISTLKPPNTKPRNPNPLQAFKCQTPSKHPTTQPQNPEQHKTPNLKPQNPSREWKNGSTSSYNCTPFLNSLLTKRKTLHRRIPVNPISLGPQQST